MPGSESDRFVKPYGPKLKTPITFKGKGRTKQAFKDETNINFILAKFQKTGVIEHQAKYQGQYGEFLAVDYHTAMNVVLEAQEMFESVPSNIRKEFDNDPGKFLAFVGDEANRDRAVELGLVPPPPEPEPAPLPDAIPE